MQTTCQEYCTSAFEYALMGHLSKDEDLMRVYKVKRALQSDRDGPSPLIGDRNQKKIHLTVSHTDICPTASLTFQILGQLPH